MTQEIRIPGSGKVIRGDEIAHYPVIAAGKLSEEADEVAYAFVSDEEFFEWAAGTPVGESFLRAEERLESKRRLFEEGVIDPEQISRNAASVRDQLQAMADAAGVEFDSRELLLRAAHEIRTTEDPSIEPAIFYDGRNFAGTSITLWDQAVPDLDKIGWGNRIYSVKLIFGAGTLFQMPYFQGPKFRMFAFPYVEFRDLDTFGFGGNTLSYYPAFVF